MTVLRLLIPDVTYRFLRAHIWMFLLRLPKALAPTLVGTKLLLPMPPDRLRKSARRWVTQVAVLQARFCAVTLLQERRRAVNSPSPGFRQQPLCTPEASGGSRASVFVSFGIFLTCQLDARLTDNLSGTVRPVQVLFLSILRACLQSNFIK